MNESDNMLALNVIIAEFNALRAELLYKLDIRHKIVSLLITSITAVVGVVIYQDKHFEFLLLVPIISTIFGYMWAVEEESIHYIGSYIRHDIRDKISTLISEINLDADPNNYKYWMGWESYFDSLRNKIIAERNVLERFFHTCDWYISHYLAFVGSSAVCLIFYVYQIIIINQTKLSLTNILILLVDLVLIILLIIRLRVAKNIRPIIEQCFLTQ